MSQSKLKCRQKVWTSNHTILMASQHKAFDFENFPLYSPEILFPEGEDRPFPALISLNLSTNLITDWQSVARLNVLAITDLRMRSNPIMETEDGGRCRQLLIASIASLFVCNGTSVDRDDIKLNNKNITGSGKFNLRGFTVSQGKFSI